MKFVIASDIHGSAHWCKKLIERYGEEKADRLIILGDILYHGPRNDLPLCYAPKEVIAMLNPLKESLLCVRGNCDTEVDQMVLDFPIMADYCIIPLADRLIYATHGHVYNSQNLPPVCQKDILLHGHTHVPVCVKNENHVYINPGSVSIPKENSPHSYILFDGERFFWKDIESGKTYKEVCISTDI
jgi:putative phosphoesterase